MESKRDLEIESSRCQYECSWCSAIGEAGREAGVRAVVVERAPCQALATESIVGLGSDRDSTSEQTSEQS